jgi:hypothetical protein
MAKSSAYLSTHVICEVRRVIAYKMIGENLEEIVEFMKNLFKKIKKD